MSISTMRTKRIPDMQVNVRLWTIALSVLSVVLLNGCGSTTELSSRWTAGQIQIDGSATEWDTLLVPIPSTQLLLGVANDDDNVYVCVEGPIRIFRQQIVGPGLTLWFERADGARTGVRYPIGMFSGGERISFSSTREDDPQNEDVVRAESPREFEIVGPGEGDRTRFSIAEGQGVQVRMAAAEGSMTYEMKIPLRASSTRPYAIGAAPGTMIKVGVESGRLPSMGPRSEEGDSGRRPGGGGPPQGGRGRGDRSGGGRPGQGAERPERPQPIDFWANVHLSLR